MDGQSCYQPTVDPVSGQTGQISDEHPEPNLPHHKTQLTAAAKEKPTQHILTQNERHKLSWAVDNGNAK